MREYLAKYEFAKTEGFRWRGGTEISRIEGFSDAVFGFAITLLVVSLEVPKTFDELAANMRGFAGFAASFFLLFYIWFSQYQFFRRYGLEDKTTLWLNALLLFIVLYFVYPLKFLFSMLFHVWTGGANEVRLPNGEMAQIIHPGQESLLMIVYASGYIAVYTVFLFMYLHAYRRRAALELNELEIFHTRHSIREFCLQMGIGTVSMGFALAGHGAVAGFTYVFVGPVMAIHGTLSGRIRRKRATAQTEFTP